MYDAQIGLNQGDSLTIKLAGGTLFIWNDKGRVSISVAFDGAEVLDVYVDEATLEVIAVTSPDDRIAVPVKTWQETFRLLRGIQETK
jgi:hypothetical protein